VLVLATIESMLYSKLVVVVLFSRAHTDQNTLGTHSEKLLRCKKCHSLFRR
jgi:hypothetical protein